MSSTPEPELFGFQVFLLHIPDERLRMLDKHERVSDFGRPIPFSQPVAEFDHSRWKPIIVFILDRDCRIIRGAIAHRGYRAGTELSQLEISNVQSIPPTPISQYARLLPSRFQKRVYLTTQSGGLLPPYASFELLELLFSIAEIESLLRLASLKSQNPIDALDPKEQMRLQQERDAGFTAMLIAGIDRDFFVQQAEGSLHGNWFLARVVDARLREDPMIANDAQLFPGFRMINKHVTGAIRLQQENTVLTILHAHRQPLEALTGSDLIYFNETFNSFVMVQYKAMEPTREGHIFRLPDKNLNREIGNMMKVQARLQSTGGDPQAANCFRLHDQPFFLKFCPRIVQQPIEPDLVPGMYFPLRFWQGLQRGEILYRNNKSKALVFNKSSPFTNAGRYLNNSEFATLVRNSWVGTTSLQSKLLLRLVEMTISEGKSVTLAVAQTEGKNP